MNFHQRARIRQTPVARLRRYTCLDGLFDAGEMGQGKNQTGNFSGLPTYSTFGIDHKHGQLIRSARSVSATERAEREALEKQYGPQLDAMPRQAIDELAGTTLKVGMLQLYERKGIQSAMVRYELFKQIDQARGGQ